MSKHICVHCGEEWSSVELAPEDIPTEPGDYVIVSSHVCMDERTCGTCGETWRGVHACDPAATIADLRARLAAAKEEVWVKTEAWRICHESEVLAIAERDAAIRERDEARQVDVFHRFRAHEGQAMIDAAIVRAERAEAERDERARACAIADETLDQLEELLLAARAEAAILREKLRGLGHEA